jgi:hypothetical protein
MDTDILGLGFAFPLETNPELDSGRGMLAAGRRVRD